VHQLQTDTTAEMARLRHELSEQKANIKAHDTAATNQARLMTEREENKRGSSWFGKKKTPSTDHIAGLLRMGESGPVNVTINNGHTIQGNMNSHSLNLGTGGLKAVAGAGTAIAGLALRNPSSVATIAGSLMNRKKKK